MAGAVDLVVRGGQVVTSDGVIHGGVAVDNGVIVAVADDERLPEGRRTVDASGKYVLPGVIDPEAHLGTYRSLYDDLVSESRAAAAAGVTTWGMMLTSTRLPREFYLPKSRDEVPTFLEALPTFFELAPGRMATDYFFIPIVSSDREVLETPELAERYGITAIKFYLHTMAGERTFGDWVPQRRGGYFGFDDGTVWLGMEAIAKVGPPGLVCLHTENWEISRIFQQRMMEAGHKEMKAWDEHSPHFVEAGHLRTYAYYAKQAGSPLYCIHTTTRETVEEIQRARADGIEVYGQTAACYLSLDHNVWKINVPLRDPATIEYLWGAVARGDVDTCGSDHIAQISKREDLEVPGDVWATKSGFPSRVEAVLPVLLSEGVSKGRISMQRVAEYASTNVAKIFGLYPKKGEIKVGSDGDLVVVDMEKEVTLTKDMVHSVAGWSVYEGWKFKGWPVMTILRGNVIAEWKGNRVELVDDEAIGEYVRSTLGECYRGYSNTPGLGPRG